ncbi:MAG TPA: hypothetical protein VMG99_09040 [Thermoplasmata archaeon]|nr:hypothetical protein [Thermoplasmata archaeon]
MALALDGSNSANFTGSSGTSGITTTLADDVIVLAITIDASGIEVDSVEVTGLTFAMRAAVDGPAERCELWWAPSAAVQDNSRVTVNLSAAASVALVVWGVSGSPSYLTPWDGGNVPRTASGTSDAATVTGITTASPRAMLLFVQGCPGAPTVTPPSGFTRIDEPFNPVCGASYLVESSAQRDLTVAGSFSASEEWQAIADALSSDFDPASSSGMVASPSPYGYDRRVMYGYAPRESP